MAKTDVDQSQLLNLGALIDYLAICETGMGIFFLTDKLIRFNNDPVFLVVVQHKLQ